MFFDESTLHKQETQDKPLVSKKNKEKEIVVFTEESIEKITSQDDKATLKEQAVVPFKKIESEIAPEKEQKSSLAKWLKVKQENKKKKVSPKVSTILPFVDIYEDGIELKKGYMDILQVQSKDVYSLNEEESKRHIYELTRYLRAYQFDLKFIAMNFPVVTTEQQNYIRRKLSQTGNRIYQVQLEKKLVELEFLERHRMNREYYLCIYADTLLSLQENKQTTKRMLRSTLPIREVDVEKQLQILFKLNNQNSSIL